MSLLNLNPTICIVRYMCNACIFHVQSVLYFEKPLQICRNKKEGPCTNLLRFLYTQRLENFVLWTRRVFSKQGSCLSLQWSDNRKHQCEGGKSEYKLSLVLGILSCHVLVVLQTVRSSFARLLEWI